ncbi:MAG TPA: hypothetical protein PK500_01435 [Candidatus Egerieousia sp.]|nr:hypothetical protein [Candidatus Egerieousia sp.]
MSDKSVTRDLKMEDNNNIERELFENAKDLLGNEHLKKVPFKVPQGYFESVEDEVRTKIKDQTPDGQWGLLHRSLKAYLGLAASFLLILGAGWGVIHFTKFLTSRYQLTAQSTIDSELLLDSLENEYVAGQLDNALAESSKDTLTIRVIPQQAEEMTEETAVDYADAVQEYLSAYPSTSVNLASLELAELEE